MSAISAMSAWFMPRVVTAGVPMRTPEVIVGLRVSLGTVFLFRVMFAWPSSVSRRLPDISRPVRSTSIRWLSVPPDTSFTPRSRSLPASAAALSTIWC